MSRLVWKYLFIILLMLGMSSCGNKQVAYSLRQGADVMEGASDVVEFIDDSGIYDLDGIPEIIDESADVVDAVADYLDPSGKNSNE